jgi:His-Xaa-Ser system protein HxsD
MTVIQHGLPKPIALSIGDSTSVLQIDTSLYELEAIFRACYKYTDRCYLFMTRETDTEALNVFFMSKCQSDLPTLVGEFCNELIDQSLRLSLSREFGPIRELIVAQAFSEGNLLDPQRDEGDYTDDPLGIGEHR